MANLVRKRWSSEKTSTSSSASSKRRTRQTSQQNSEIQQTEQTIIKETKHAKKAKARERSGKNKKQPTDKAKRRKRPISSTIKLDEKSADSHAVTVDLCDNNSQTRENDQDELNSAVAGTVKGTEQKQDRPINKGFVQVNSKKLTEESLQKLTRLDTIEALLPTVTNTPENEVTFYTDPQCVTQVLQSTTIPSYTVLYLWKEQLQQHTKALSSSGYFYTEVRDGRYSIEAIDQMIMLHKAKNIRCAVEKELEWFAGRLIMPKSVMKHPSSESLKRFQDLIFRHKWDEELKGYGMNGEELAKVCGNRWISDDIVQWVLDLLNSSQKETLCIFNHAGKGSIINMREHVGEKRDLPSSVFFLFSVVYSKDGVFIGSDKQPGCHFSFCFMTKLMDKVKIVYGDTLGWPVPNNLTEIISAYYIYLYSCPLPNVDIIMCHDPKQTASYYEHNCSTTKSTCAKNFPLQKCESICGVVTLMMAAFACLKRPFFDMLTEIYSDKNPMSSLDLQHVIDPTSNAKYLRRVLATWLSDKEICVDYLVPRKFEAEGTDEESGAESEQDISRELEVEQGVINGILQNGAAHDANMSCHIQSNQELTDLNKDTSDKIQLESSSQSSSCHQSNMNFASEDLLRIPPESLPAFPSTGHHRCPKCSYFTKLIFNMKRHIKRNHTDITFTPPLSHSCPSCTYSSNKSYDVYKHISRCHPGVQWTAQMLRRGPKAKEGPKRHKCPQCPYQSNSKHNINRHQQSCHDTTQTLESSRVGKCQCLECGQRLYKISDLRRHLSSKHAFIFKTETLTLKSYQEFEEWKASIEITEGCSFTKTTGDKVIHGKKRTQYFQCNRSGTFRSNNKGKRKQKWQGSCKIESNCTSTMVASILESGQVEVECVCTHYSHQIELQHVWIPKGRKRDNATKGSQNREQIISDIRNSESIGKHCTSNHQEIPDIVDTFGLNMIQRQTNDQLSLLSWIKQWEAFPDLNPILCYKFEGSTDWVEYGLKRDEFMVVVQTELQKEMAQTFGNSGICCDSVVLTGQSEFALTTLQVVDEFGLIHPITWCLSSSNARAFVEIFFNNVKENCGNLSPAWFMSDVHDHFHDAWTAVFELPTKRLICPWYVDKAWTMTLKKIGNVSIEARVYKLLRILMEQKEQKLFEDHVHTLLERLSVSAKTQEFRKYFLTQWVSRKSEWMYCCNTNTATAFVEPFYQTFSNIYSKAYIIERIDTCLLHLLKYERDCLVNRRVSLTKGKPAAGQEADIQLRHAAGVEMDAVSVRLCPKDPHRWEVVDEDQVIHIVQESAAVCQQRKCPISCLNCRVCVHQYLCNCLDSLINTTICKHIHLVHSTVHKEQEADVRDIQWLKDRIQSRVHTLMAVVSSATNENFSALQELDSKLGVCSSLLDSRLLWGPSNLLPSKQDESAQQRSSGSTISKKVKRRTGSGNAAAPKMCMNHGDMSGIKDGVLDQSAGENVPMLSATPSDTAINGSVLPISLQKASNVIPSATGPTPPIPMSSPHQISPMQQHSHSNLQQIPPVMTSHMYHPTSQPSGIITYPLTRTIMSAPVDHTTPASHQFATLSHQPMIHTPDGPIHQHNHQLDGITYQQLRPQISQQSQLGPISSSQTPIDYQQTVRPVVMGNAETQHLAAMSEEQLTTLAGVAALFGEG